MIKCEICQKEFISFSALGGHISGHVRRNEIDKVKTVISHQCDKCDLVFKTGPELGGHKAIHRKSFDELLGSCAIKSRLLLERGVSCENCKLDKWCNNKIPLELDHIDGNPENNKKENLRLLCPNCHALTPTYRGKNVGKVNNSKRQRIMKKYTGRYR